VSDGLRDLVALVRLALHANAPWTARATFSGARSVPPGSLPLVSESVPRFWCEPKDTPLASVTA